MTPVPSAGQHRRRLIPRPIEIGQAMAQRGGQTQTNPIQHEAQRRASATAARTSSTTSATVNRSANQPPTLAESDSAHANATERKNRPATEMPNCSRRAHQRANQRAKSVRAPAPPACATPARAALRAHRAAAAGKREAWSAAPFRDRRGPTAMESRAPYAQAAVCQRPPAAPP